MRLDVILLTALAMLGAERSHSQPSGILNRNSMDTVSITILQTADIHGQLDSHTELFREGGQIAFKERGGFAHIKSLFDDERAKNPGRTIIVDGGDLIQGSGYAALSEGAIFSEIVRNMGYDLLIPGNWEVVYGKDKMIRVLEDYRTPVIVQNMMHEQSGENLFPSYWIKEIEGIRLGFIGINDPDVPVRQNPSFSKGIHFTGIDRQTSDLISTIKHDQKLDVLFLITHLGIFKQVDLASQDVAREADYILGNDTHERIRKPIEGKYAKVTEPGAFGSFVGKLTLHFIDGKLVGDDYELMDVDPEKYPADKHIRELVEKAKKPYANYLETVIGYTSVPLYRYLTAETPVDNMITDAMRWKTGVDIAISNGFRFGNPIVPLAGKPAPITRANLWNLLPVNEAVKTGVANGKQIREWLEKEMHNVFAQNPRERFGGWLVRYSGMKVEFDSQAPKGKRIISITVNDEPLQDDRDYSISACVRPGDPLDNLCRMRDVREVEVKDYTVHDAVEEYLKNHLPVAPGLERRAYSEALGEYSFSDLPGTDYVFR